MKRGASDGQAASIEKYAADILIWLLLLTMPFWINRVGGYTQLGTQVVVMALAAMALNFLLGYTGVLVVRPCRLFRSRRLRRRSHHQVLVPSTFAGMAVGVLTAVAAAAIIGLLIVHLRGIYFAMVTIAFGQVFYFIAYRWNNVTGGDDGLSSWHRMPIDFGFAKLDILHNPVAFYYFVLFFFAVSVAIMASLLRSPFGRTLLAIRENERRARFLGVPVDRHIWLSWLISCTFVGLAGTLYALLNNFADPHTLYWEQSGDLRHHGGAWRHAFVLGPLIGAAIFVVLQDYVSTMTQNWMSFIGLFFVLVVLFFPRGVLGIVRRRAAHESVAG